MSLAIDIRYVGLISSRLDKFKRKNNYTYNFRCPICLDSKKSKNKARGFLYRKRNDLYFICHNCGCSHTFSVFLKILDSTLQREYVLEKFAKGEVTKSNYKKPELEILKPQPVTRFQKPKILEFIQRISELEDGHVAKEYIRNRLIPQDRWTDLYFSGDFKSLVDEVKPEHEYKLSPNDPRIIIPFFDKQKDVIAFQGRSLQNKGLRYITIKLKDVPKVYGMDRIKWKEHIYIFEGPIDSLFVPNSLAAAGADIPRLDPFKDHLTVVYDNEPRNKAIVKRMTKIIGRGYSICIWPESLNEKDINNMILSGMQPDQIKIMIDKNTYSGMKANIRLQEWKRC